MKIVKTKFKNLLILKTNIFKDKRGYFKEIYKKKLLKKKILFLTVFHIQKKNFKGITFSK